MFATTTPGPKGPPLPARAAVETVRVGSAGLSASYYAMLGLTVHPAAAIGLGLVAGAADYVKGNALGAIVDGPGIVRRLIAVPLFAVLFVASMIAVDGVLLKLRDTLAAGPAHVIGAHDRAAAEYRAAAGELAKLAAVRTPDAIRADMDRAPVRRSVFNRTAECTDITKDESLEACRPLLTLRTEMADAIRKRELEAARDKAARRLEELGPRPSSADPQAEAFAHAAGLEVSTAAWILIAVVGFAIELAACFGMYVLGHSRSLTPPQAASRERAGVANAPAARGALGAGQSGEPSDADLAEFRARFVGPDIPPDDPKPGASVVPFRPAKPAEARPTGRPGAPAARGQSAPAERLQRVSAQESALRMIRQDLAAGRTFPSQAELCRTVGVPRSTMSDWLTEWEAAGAIPPRRTIGRCKAVG